MALSSLSRLSVTALAIMQLSVVGATQFAPAPSNPDASLFVGDWAHLFGWQFDPSFPADVPSRIKPEWVAFMGEYGPPLAKFYVLEDGGELRMLAGWFDLETLRPVSPDVFELPANGPHGAKAVTFLRNAAREVSGVRVGDVVYDHRTFDGPGQVFRITPLKPLAELRDKALAARPPIEKGAFRNPELIQLDELDPTIKLDIRYATNRNFLGAPLYAEARAYMQRPAAEAVVRASQRLHALGYGLLIHDSYRPWYVTKIFWDGTPTEKHIFVANPDQGSRHNRGCAVDLTLYDLKTGEPVHMTGGYDEMTERSYPFYPGGTARERWHRDLLRRMMEAEGFTVYEEEWWHFDYKDWKQYPILNFTFEQLEKSHL